MTYVELMMEYIVAIYNGFVRRNIIKARTSI